MKNTLHAVPELTSENINKCLRFNREVCIARSGGAAYLLAIRGRPAFRVALVIGGKVKLRLPSPAGRSLLRAVYDANRYIENNGIKIPAL